MDRRTIGMLVLAAALLAPSLAFAQERERGERGGDPAQMRQRFMERFREQLGASEEEWKVLEPKLTKVMTAQRDARGGMFGGRRGGRRGGDDNAAQENQSAVEKASTDLRTTLENKDAPADQIQAKLTALRDARTKARTELEAAQKELKELLTQRQEAVMVTMGMLD